MSNKQQTAVEWLICQFYDNERTLSTGQLLQAREMEKEQHFNTAHDFYYGKYSLKNFEDYYNETYRGNK
jgi:hypothetical protein